LGTNTAYQMLQIVAINFMTAHDRW